MLAARTAQPTRPAASAPAAEKGRFGRPAALSAISGLGWASVEAPKPAILRDPHGLPAGAARAGVLSSRAVDAAEVGDTRRRVPELDGLRGLAILLVLVRHYVWGEMEPSPGSAAAALKAAIALSWSGVDLFFVLSGFLLTGVLLKNRGSPAYFRTFYVRRACRIVPPYYALVAVAFASTALMDRGLVAQAQFRHLLPLWSYLTFTQNVLMAGADNFGSQWLGVTWSLAIEEQFYLCLPLLVWLIAPPVFPYAAAALVLLAPAVRMALFDFHPAHGFAAYVLMPARADALLLGALLAWGWRSEGWRRNVADSRSALYLSLLVLLAGAALLTRHGWFATTEPIVYVGYSWLAALYAVLMLLVLSAGAGPLGWIMRRAWLRGLGRVSYALYLVHVPISRILHAALLGDYPRLVDRRTALVTVLSLLASLGLASASWVLMERRIIRFGHSFSYWPPSPAPEERAAALGA